MIFRWRGLLLFALLLLILAPRAASAQTGTPGGDAQAPGVPAVGAQGPGAPAAVGAPPNGAALSAPNTEAFPQFEIYLDVRNSQGGFIHGLQASQIRLVEDGRPVDPVEVQELHAGVQIVAAINPGPTFGVRNPAGISRYESVLDALGQWAQSRQGSNIDAWGLVVTGGAETNLLANPQDWWAALQAQSFDARQAAPNVETIARAINLAATPSPRPGMGRAVLLVTAPVEGKAALVLDSIAAQAQQQKVPIFIWLVGAPGVATTQAGTHMAALAQATGGQFFAYSGAESLPSPESYLDPQRSLYHLSYTTRIHTSGDHQLAAEVETENGPLQAPAQTFAMDIRPPEPAFIALEPGIERLPPEKPAGLGAAQSPEALSTTVYTPTHRTLHILVDFPDGRMRSLQRTALFVDGELAAENTRAPYDQFVWDLKDYSESGSHILRVQAEDSLGLVGTSIEYLVQIQVDRPRSNLWGGLARSLPLLIGLSTVVLSALLLLGLLLGGRLRPNTLGRSKPVRRRGDPVTQPVPMHSDPAALKLPNPFTHLHWPQRHVAPKAYAFLNRLGDEEPSSASSISLTADEMTLGSDPHLATLVLDDPSVEGLHARLVRTESGDLRLADEGSVAGTWINYSPVSASGVKLEHGDLIHIGRVGFRFTLRQPAQTRRPVVATAQEAFFSTLGPAGVKTPSAPAAIEISQVDQEAHQIPEDSRFALPNPPAEAASPKAGKSKRGTKEKGDSKAKGVSRLKAAPFIGGRAKTPKAGEGDPLASEAAKLVSQKPAKKKPAKEKPAKAKPSKDGAVEEQSAGSGRSEAGHSKTSQGAAAAALSKLHLPGRSKAKPASELPGPQPAASDPFEPEIQPVNTDHPVDNGTGRSKGDGQPEPDDQPESSARMQAEGKKSPPGSFARRLLRVRTRKPIQKPPEARSSDSSASRPATHPEDLENQPPPASPEEPQA